MIYTVKIEQTFKYPNRMKYIAQTDTFIEKSCLSLSYVRNVRQPYGWIKESGIPPNEHIDVIIMTDKEYELGDEERVKIIGVFRRNDGDHKLVGVLEELDINDFSELSDKEKNDMHLLYPREDVGEGWLGREQAEGIIEAFFERKEKKTIIIFSMLNHNFKSDHIIYRVCFNTILTQYYETKKYLNRIINIK